MVWLFVHSLISPFLGEGMKIDCFHSQGNFIMSYETLLSYNLTKKGFIQENVTAGWRFIAPGNFNV